MKISVFSAKNYDRDFFLKNNTNENIDLCFYDTRLSLETIKLAEGSDAICAFVNDQLDELLLEKMAQMGIKCLLMRCAGFNNVDLDAAKKYGIRVERVPAYSPESVAEHAIALMMTLNRRIHKAYQRTRDANFSLEGLIGFNMHGRTAGVVGTGKIGLATLRILKGFGCRLLVSDPYENPEAIALGAEYVSIDRLIKESNIISLHCPLTSENVYMIGKNAFAKMQKGTVLVNTSRGKLVDSFACIEALKDGTLGGLALDVYENEQELFFEDLSSMVIQDDIFRRLSACHNVIFTGHQAFLTEEALTSIAQTTLYNFECFMKNEPSGNEVIEITPSITQ